MLLKVVGHDNFVRIMRVWGAATIGNGQIEKTGMTLIKTVGLSRFDIARTATLLGVAFKYFITMLLSTDNRIRKTGLLKLVPILSCAAPVQAHPEAFHFPSPPPPPSCVQRSDRAVELLARLSVVAQAL